MRKFILTVLLLLCSVSNTYAAEIDMEVAEKAETYLNSINSFAADFTQIDPQNATARGKFYLKKPGKFRWEYPKALINSNGKQLVYYDKELKEATYANVKDTLAGFLARPKISFSGDVKLLEAVQDENFAKITLTQKAKPEEGNLMLVFSVEPFAIIGMQVTDTSKGKTSVAFKNQKVGVPIEDKKFVFKDPKFYKNVWDR